MKKYNQLRDKLLAAYRSNRQHMLQQLRLQRIQLRLSIKKDYRHELYRKSIHLSSLWIPTLIYFASQFVAIAVFAVIFIGDALLEYGNYKKWKWARRTFGMLFFKTLRNKERVRTQFQVSGSMYVLAAAIVCTLLFSKPIAMIAMTVMLISDTCAALFGKAFGTRKLYKNKSLEGTAAFFLSALFINMLYEPLFHFTTAGVIACTLATMAEMFEDKLGLDDNLSIPLVIGLTLTFLA